MRSSVHYIPIATTVFATFFAVVVFRRYREKGKGAHLAWWAGGMLVFAVGTFTEAFVTLFGWNEAIFRAWYISGALLGGAPLAQGTVYLLLPRRTADRLTVALVTMVVVASIFILLTPLNYELVEPWRLSGKVIVWSWARLFSPFINLYALFFLVGGAALSAYRFSKSQATYHRFVGNVFIAVGGLLPGIGGTFTRFGYTEVLYVTELLGLLAIYAGYRWNISPRAVLAPAPQASSA
ncbi:MAG: hypothetical protein ACRD35_08485 [Candidatus Acidiferrales bacterium]